MTRERKSSHIYRVIALLIVLAGLWFLVRFLSDRAQVQTLSSLAASHLEDGDLADADHSYDQILAIESQNTSALLGKTKVALETGDYQSAEQYLNRLEEQKFDSPEYRELLYHYALLAGDYALAESLLVSESSYEPTASEYRAIIQGLLTDEFFAKAAQTAQRALAAFPNDPDLQLVGFDAYLANDDADLAISLYERGLVLEDPMRQNALAKAYEKKGSLEKSVDLWAASLAYDVNQPEIVAKLTNYYIREGDVKSYWELRRKLLERRLALPHETTNLFGNLAANVRYRGLAAEQNGVIYFTDTEGRGIYSVRGRDLKGIRQLYEGPVEGLNVAGEYFYFVSPSDRKLYRLRTDGTELVKLSEQDASAPLVWGKSLLFLEGASSSRVMKIDLSAWESGGDGEAPEDRDAREAGEAGEPVALTRTAVKHYAADGEWLYFCGIGNSGLFRVPLGGEDSGAGSDVVLEEQIATGNISDVVVDEFSRLYFLRNEGKEIVSSANDGSDLQVLSEEPAAYLTYGNRKLYYVSWTPHSLSLTGRESQTLASNLSEELSVLSEWIFSIGYEAEGVLNPQIFTFRPDGTEWAILSMGE